MSHPFIFFDVGNVLMRFDHGRVCSNLQRLADIAPEDTQRVVFDEGLQWRYERGEIDNGAYCQAIRDALSVSLDDDTILSAASDIFWANIEMFPVVAQLRQWGFPLGIFSNTCHAHWSWITERHEAIFSMFSVVAASHLIGAMKPDPQAYDRAIAMAQRPAEEIIFIDDKSENIEAAKQKGIRGIHHQCRQLTVAKLDELGVHLLL